jgi:hypothetical protein
MKLDEKTDQETYTISAPVMLKAFEAFAQFKYELPEELRDTRKYCYVRTALGYLEIDVMSLLCLTARLVNPRVVNKSDGKVEITDEIVSSAVEVIQRLPEYLLNDLVGIAFEEFFCHHYREGLQGKRWPEISRRLYDRKKQTGNLGSLQMILTEFGSGSLEIDDVRDAFTALFSRRGYAGEKPWKTFVKGTIRTKRRPGRPRKSEYDWIYQQRASKPEAESYGKLVKQILSSDPETTAVKLNRAKAAVAYRKRQTLSLQ